MRTVGQRIEWLMGHSGKSSLGELALGAGLGRSAVAAIVRRRGSEETAARSGEALRRLAEAYGVSFEWLATGQGEPGVGEIDALEAALYGAVYSSTAEAAARAHRDTHHATFTAEEWTHWLRRLEQALAQMTPSPPTSEERPSVRAKKA